MNINKLNIYSYRKFEVSFESIVDLSKIIDRRILDTVIIDNTKISDVSSIIERKYVCLEDIYQNFEPLSVNHRDLVHLANFYFEQMYNKNGLISIHSSAITKHEKTVLFVGGSLQGKSLLTFWAQQEDNWQYLSGERSLLTSELEFVAGTNRFIVGLQSYLQFGIEKNKVFKNIGMISWKNIFEPYEIFYCNPLPISAICYPKVLPAACKGYFDKELFDYNKSSRFLYPLLGEEGNGNYLLFNNKFSLPTFSVEPREEIRKNCLKQLRNIPIYFLQGTPSEILCFINTL